MVITIDKPKAVGEIVDAVREHARSDIIIVARARDAEHARQLYKQKRLRRRAGNNRGEPAAFRGDAGRSRRADRPVIASIHEKRDEFREQLQGAAGRPTRGLRASQLKRTP